MLRYIEEFVKNGFAVHWLHPKSKRPIGEDWASKPVASLEMLRKTERKINNAGVRLGKFSKVTGGYLHVIDLDIRDDSHADIANDKLLDLFPQIFEYPTVQSGSGGPSRHYYIVSDKPFRSKKLAHSTEKVVGKDGKSHWAWEIELFGTGKQVVMPPSIHPDTNKPYRWLKPFDFVDLDLGAGPIVDSKHLMKLTEHGSVTEEDLIGEDRVKPLGLTYKEAADILAKLPSAAWREDRDGWLTVGMALHHEFLGADDAFKMWCDFSRLSDKFDAKDQKRVWRSFRNKSKPVRMATLVTAAKEADLDAMIENLEDDFDDLADPIDGDRDQNVDPFSDLLGDSEGVDEDAPRVVKLKKAKVDDDLGNVPPKIKRLNNRHAIAYVNGRTVIITEHADGRVAYGSITDLHNWYENDRVATEKATEPVTKAWLRHKKRRQYPEGIVFKPNQETPGAYNHWRGFAVEPDSTKSCRRILRHIEEIVCSGNQEYYRYMIGWLAHMIQRPEEKPGVAVVIRGPKGAGKDTVADYVAKLFPDHRVKISQQEHLVGRFNQHQEKCLLLHVEEGFWAGNKNAEGALKSLITSETVFIEPKGLNGFHVDSVLRLYMTSNERWVVPATADERRFFVLNIDGRYSRTGSHAKERDYYFDGIREEMRHGGPAAFLHFLLTYDLRDFNVRNYPDTDALAEQKLEGIKNVEKWWYEQLQIGRTGFDVYDSRGPMYGTGSWSSEWISTRTDMMYDHYEDWVRKHRYEGEQFSEAQFFRRFREMSPLVKRKRFRVEGEDRPYFYVVPSLKLARREFENHIRSAVQWGDDYIDADDPPEEDEI